MLQKQTKVHDKSEGVKYAISRFEEEEFNKFYENGGREKLKKVKYFKDGKLTRRKWGHWDNRVSRRS